MLAKKSWIGVLFLVVFLPAVVAAQGVIHGKWWHDSSISDELGLSEGERRALDEEYAESRRKMIDLKSDIEKHRFELDLLLGAGELDRPKIMERYEGLEQTRRKLSRERFEMLINIRETLGPERYQKLKLMRDKHRKDRKRYYRDKYDRDGSDDADGGRD